MATNSDLDPPSAVAPAPPSLSSVTTTKLTEKNCLHWKQIVEAVISANRLERFIVAPQIPTRFLTDEDRRLDRVNPEFRTWEAQEQHLLIWLLNSVSESIHRVVGCLHAWQLWDELHNFFNSQTKACSTQPRSELRHMVKGDRKIS